MAKKQKSPESSSASEARIFGLPAVVAGIAVVVLFAAIAIGLFSLFGGSTLSDDAPEEPPLPALSEAPVLPPIDGADVLANTSFDEMSDDEVELIRSELERVFGDGEFRVSGRLSATRVDLDVVRRQGQTIATRQYRFGTVADDEKLSLFDTIIFYCATADGAVDAYRADRTPLETTARYERQSALAQPFDREFIDGDWSDPRDLGTEVIDGRQARGVQVPWGANDMPRQMWFDAVTGELLRRTDLIEELEASENTIFFERRPPRIEPPPELETPPCLDEVYPDG